jgi:probable phosphoglycerate mutase
MTAHPSSTVRVYLIRHGETEWSLTGQHTGHSDIALTAHGEDEARELGQRLAGMAFDQVLCSPLKRAQQTCVLAGLENRMQIEADLAEWDYGDYEGLRSADIRSARPHWAIFNDGCPNGERPAQITARADRLIARLRTLNGTVALFTHGHIGSALATRWIDLALAEARHFTLGTASLSQLGYDSHQPDVPVIALWNAVAPPGAPPNRPHRELGK